MVNPGDELGAYRLRQRLGGSAWASVWSADGPDGPVAVKILADSAHGQTQIHQRFVASAQRLVGLSLSGVNPVLHVHDAERTWFVSPLLPARDLDAITAAGGLAAPLALRLMAEVATIVADLHAHRFEHHDLKPGNVHLTDAGRPVVTDVDLIRPSDVTAGAPMGTFAYAAPEQAIGIGQDGAASDVYSLAMLAVCLLHRATLPPGAFVTPAAFIERLELPTDLTAALKQATAWEPAARPTAAALAATLDDHTTASLHELRAAATPSPMPEGPAIAQRAGRRSEGASPGTPKAAPPSSTETTAHQPSPRENRPVAAPGPPSDDPRPRPVRALSRLRRPRPAGAINWIFALSMLASLLTLGGLVVLALLR